MSKRTAKQQRFIDFFDGNATEAAAMAGYKGNRHTLEQVGLENLRKPVIAEAIAARELSKGRKHIASREERQRFWTVMMKTAEKDSDRLKGSELLGRSQADFTERHELGLSADNLEALLVGLPQAPALVLLAMLKGNEPRVELPVPDSPTTEKGSE